MKRILITDYVHPCLVAGLEQRGFIVDYDIEIDMSSLPDIINEYDGIIINSKILMNKEMIDSGSKLKFIGRLGSGMEIIDVPYAAEKGILTINTPTGNNNAVAEHTMGMLLSLANNLRQADADVRRYDWNRELRRGWELKGKTVGIIGFGHTGSQLAKKLQSWEVTVIAHDKYKTDFGSDFGFVANVSLEDILERSDIISLHLPLTEETKHLVNSTFIESCKDGVVIVNTSRGKVIETKALITGLMCGKLKGACLDVFENEKTQSYTDAERLMYEKLFSQENVVLSPHIAGWTHESLEKIATLMLDLIDSTDINV